jgi:hypothetical protein
MPELRQLVTSHVRARSTRSSPTTGTQRVTMSRLGVFRVSRAVDASRIPPPIRIIRAARERLRSKHLEE